MKKSNKPVTKKSVEKIILDHILSGQTKLPLDEFLGEPIDGPMCEGQLVIIKLFDHNGEFQSYDVARDHNSIISIGCKDKEGKHQEYDLYPVHKVEEWAKRWGFRVEIETRTIEFSVSEV